MKAIKIKLTQTSANYKVPEQLIMKNSLPLPYISTVLGAIHTAVGWNEYHSIKVSIKGDYENIATRLTREIVIYNTVMTDRGKFVYYPSANALGAAYIMVAEPFAGGGLTRKSDIKTGEGYKILRRDLLDDYFMLKEKLSALNSQIKELTTTRREKLKGLSTEERKIVKSHYDPKIRDLNDEKVKAQEELDHYRSIEYIPNKIHTLHNIKLTIHLLPQNEDDFQAIMEHIYNIKSIGRSGDFIDIKEAKEVELHEAKSGVILEHTYIPKAICNCFETVSGRSLEGTVYWVNEKYTVDKDKRIFNKIPCLWKSNINLIRENNNSYEDQDGDILIFINS